MAEGHGRADYLLFVDRQAVGTIEAKPKGTTLTEVEIQSSKYPTGLPGQVQSGFDRLPFAYQSTGVETRFTNGLDPDPRSRPVFTFHRPETVAAWIDEHDADPDRPTLRHRLRHMPPLEATGLWQPQFEAIENLEASPANTDLARSSRWRPGSGKTFTAANVSYRLVKHAGRAARPLPRGPRQPRPPDAEGVPAVRHARRRPQVHRALQRPAPDLEHARPGRARHASRPSSGSTRSCAASRARRGARRAAPRYELEPLRAGRGRLQPRHPDRDLRRRHRRRVPPLDLRRSGGRCSSTSTPSSIGLTATPVQADLRLLRPEPRDGVRPRRRPSPTG